MLLNGILVASTKIKSIRDSKEYTILDNKLFLAIFGVGCFFGVGAFGIDKLDFIVVLLTAVGAFIVGIVARYLIQPPKE
ncbi:MAG: hypothetical protein ACI4JI_04525 [Ruminiclostridium sp.]